jgi:septum site-determining protein MinD
MKTLVDELRKDFDYVILDCPAGIEQGFQNAIAAADRALIVTTPEVSAVRDADRIIGLLEANDVRNNHLIVNRLNIDMMKHGNMMSADDVVEVLSIDLIGVVPYDEKIVVATNTGTPLAGDGSMVGNAYMNICHRIMGEKVEFMDLDAESGFFSKLRGLFRK